MAASGNGSRRKGRGKPKANYNQALSRLQGLERSHYFQNPAIRKPFGAVFQDWEKMPFLQQTIRGTGLLPSLPHLITVTNPGRQRPQDPNFHYHGRTTPLSAFHYSQSLPKPSCSTITTQTRS